MFSETKRRSDLTWSLDYVGSQEFSPLLLVALLSDVTCETKMLLRFKFAEKHTNNNLSIDCA